MKVKTIGIDLAKDVFGVHGVDIAREDAGAQVRYAQAPARLAGKAGALPGGDGSVRLGTPLGARDREARPHGEADESTVREALSQGQQE